MLNRILWPRSLTFSVNMPSLDQLKEVEECRVVHLMNMGSHTFVIGQVEGTFISEDCVTDGKPDAEKIRPLIFDMEASTYLSFGQVVATAFSVGRGVEKKGSSSQAKVVSILV